MTEPGDFIMVPMPRDEALLHLKSLVKELPYPIPYNFEHNQWDLMLNNLEAVERNLAKAKRVLAAIAEANSVNSV